MLLCIIHNSKTLHVQLYTKLLPIIEKIVYVYIQNGKPYTYCVYSSGPQPFWCQGPVLWKAIFAGTGVSGETGSGAHVVM